ncbi:hypothetical protein FOZ63_006594 [Perkinsus olseni]|uniref:Uncharacterized protein n=1 Tax=Perkinsus olseni TaxID=32597 RepID=A0A7J6S7E7_PEROL|nr:hypothetical protein FOZ63_006594 [Perkinsus olseni]
MEIYFIIVDLDRLLIDYREGIDRLLVERYGHSPANLTSHSIEGCVRTLKAIDPDIAQFVAEKQATRVYRFYATLPRCYRRCHVRVTPSSTSGCGIMNESHETYSITIGLPHAYHAVFDQSGSSKRDALGHYSI